MSRLIFVSLFTSTWILCSAQVRLGVKGGVSTYDLGANDALHIVTDTDEFLLNVKDSKYGYHVGVIMQAAIGVFLIQPEVVFNSNSVDYSFEDVGSSSVSNVFSEKYQNLDIPLLLGLKAGPMRLMAGPVGHYFLKSSSELSDFENYNPEFEDLTFGWQAGIGVDLLNLMLDIRYEGNFYTFGNHFNFGGNSYAFDNNPARLMASLAITIK